MTFFAVFYNSNSFQRYNELYKVVKKMSGYVVEVVIAMRCRVPSKAHARRALRYILASNFVFIYGREGGALQREEWNKLKAMRLLTQQEVRYLDTLDCHAAEKSIHLLHWSLEDICAGIPDWFVKHDDLVNGMYDKVLNIRHCQAKIKDTLDLPMPFQYFHIMSFMMTINLVLWSYSLACKKSLLTPLLYLFIQMVFQGIRELSAALADPFGDDEVDFPIENWLVEIVRRNAVLMESGYNPTFSIAEEVPLKQPKEKDVDIFADAAD